MTSLLDFECHRLASKHSSPARKPFGGSQQRDGDIISLLTNNNGKCFKMNNNPLPATDVLDVSYRNVSPNALFTGVMHLPTQYVMELNYKGNSLGGGGEWSLPQFLDKVSCVFPNLQHLHLDSVDQLSNKNNDPSSQQEFYLRLYILFRMPDLKSINGVPVTAYEQQLARPPCPSGVPISLRDNPDWIRLTEQRDSEFTDRKMGDIKSSPHSTTVSIIEPLILRAKEENLLIIGSEQVQKPYLKTKIPAKEDLASFPSSPPSLHKSNSALTSMHRSLSPPLQSNFQQVSTTDSPFPTRISAIESRVDHCDCCQENSSQEEHVAIPQMVSFAADNVVWNGDKVCSKTISAYKRDQLKPVNTDTQQHSNLTQISPISIHLPYRKKVVTFQDGINEGKTNKNGEPQVDFLCEKDTGSVPCDPSPSPSMSDLMRRKRDQWRKYQKFSRNQVCSRESVLSLNYSSDNTDDEDQTSYTC